MGEPASSQSPKRLKKSEDDSVEAPTARPAVHYQDPVVDAASYCSFASSSTKPSVQQILRDVSSEELGDDEEEQKKKKIAAARKLLFPSAVGASFSEVSDTLRNERRQEFCPIYDDETPEQIALRLAKRKPVGSLLAKRIRWDDLKRKREEDERQAQMQLQYASYGPAYNQQSSFANPYEQYYTTVQNQYDMMLKLTQAQQEYSGFWPEYQQSKPVGNDQAPPSNYTPADYHYLQYLRHMQPPPPPPDAPY